MAKHAILQTFYASRKWRELRLSLIAERGNQCQQCGKIIAKSIEIIGHHTTELTPECVSDSSMSFNPDKVLLICRDCHDRVHQRFGYRSNHKKVYLVYGPPLSGKTTLVKQQIKRGDIVIDIDRLYEALSGFPCYDKPDNLFPTVMGIHNVLIDNMKTRYGKWHNAWVIGGYADKYKRERLADDLGAELIFCHVSKEECMQRLDNDEDRRYRKHEWGKYIEKWFESYRE